MEDNIIILEDEQGNEIEFAIIDIFDFNETRYFAMLEIDAKGEEADEVLLMKLDDIDEDGELIMIDNEDELQAAFDEFLRRDEEEDV